MFTRTSAAAGAAGRSLTVRQGETVGPRGLGKPPCCGAWPGWSGRKAAPSPVFRRGSYVFQEDRLCGVFFRRGQRPPGNRPDPPEILRHLERSWARPAVPGGRCRNCPAGCAAGWPSPGRVRRAAASAAGRGLQGADDQCRRDTVAISAAIRRGRPCCASPTTRRRPPCWGPLSGPVRPYDCDMEPKKCFSFRNFSLTSYQMFGTIQAEAQGGGRHGFLFLPCWSANQKNTAKAGGYTIEQFSAMINKKQGHGVQV